MTKRKDRKNTMKKGKKTGQKEERKNIMKGQQMEGHKICETEEVKPESTNISLSYPDPEENH